MSKCAECQQELPQEPTCATCGQSIPKSQTVKVRYWMIGPRPRSIDRPPEEREIASYEHIRTESIDVPISKIIKGRDGKRYYRMVIGHGDYSDLLVEEPKIVRV